MALHRYLIIYWMELGTPPPHNKLAEAILIWKYTYAVY